MGGRNNNSGCGHGRGCFGGQGKTNNNKNKENNKKDYSKLQFQVGTAKQASDFVNIKKHCINYIEKSFVKGHYMAAALEQKADYDFTSEKPAPLVLLPEDDADKALQLNNKSKNESAKIEYQLNLEQYNEKVEQFKQNKFKTYAIIWDKCSAMMKQSIEAQENYDKTKRDAYLLFDSIEGLSYNYPESKYPMEI